MQSGPTPDESPTNASQLPDCPRTVRGQKEFGRPPFANPANPANPASPISLTVAITPFPANPAKNYAHLFLQGHCQCYRCGRCSPTSTRPSQIYHFLPASVILPRPPLSGRHQEKRQECEMRRLCNFLQIPLSIRSGLRQISPFRFATAAVCST
jgi:hypothetical protein